MRILYLSYDGMTDPLGQSQVLPYLAGLRTRGYDIALLSAEKPGNFARLQPVIAQFAQDNALEWHPLAYHKSPPVLSTLYDLWAMWRRATRLHRQRPFAVVHCRSYLTALLGLRLKRKYGIKFVFDMRGFWADERVEGGLWNLRNPLYRFIYQYFKHQESAFIRAADCTISLTHRARQTMLGWPGLADARIRVVPCCVDTALFDPARVPPDAARQFCQSLGIGLDDFVLLYLGSVGTWYMLDEMLDFFERLLLQRPQARFLLVTTEAAAPIHRRSDARQLPRHRVIIHRAERAQVPTAVLAADISIFFIRPTFSKQASSPTKLAELMAMGVPVVANAGVGDTDEIIRAYPPGWLVTGFDAAAYDAVIRQLAPATIAQRAALRQGAETTFSLRDGVAAYAEVYQTVVGQ